MKSDTTPEILHTWKWVTGLETKVLEVDGILVATTNTVVGESESHESWFQKKGRLDGSSRES